MEAARLARRAFDAESARQIPISGARGGPLGNEPDGRAASGPRLQETTAAGAQRWAPASSASSTFKSACWPSPGLARIGAPIARRHVAAGPVAGSRRQSGGHGLLQVDVDLIEEPLGREPLLLRADQQGEILGHKTG